MEIRNENSVPEPVMPTAENLIRYQTLVSLLDTIHERGEIDDSVRDTAEKLMAIRCGLNNNSIFI